MSLPSSRQAAMEEKTIWTGNPSHWLNFWFYIGSILIVPIPFAIARWFRTRFTTYRVTNQRIITITGIFTRRTQEVELYRVKDYSIVSPFFLRMVHRGTLVMTTSDKTTTIVSLSAVPNVEQLRDDIRRSVEILRDIKRVREVDYEGDNLEV